ncbi:MAG: PLP-dependent aminotransferase family protein, partial [Flavobacteriaceae bacterium]|nr:PLP-dependent aminotransferase family protein [Flavobacteriaceae bacterium]
IDRQSETAIYLQIVTQMINAIQRGFLTKGMKLPGTRKLSQMLNTHRNTITAVYDELEAQGWIEVLPNRGSFVINKSDGKPHKIKSYDENSLARYPSQTKFNFKKSNILDNPFDSSNCLLAFNDGSPDLRLSQVADLAKRYSSDLKRKKNRKYAENPNQRDFFKKNLSNFLNLTRGLHISKDNIVITRSVEMSLFLVSEILLSPQDIVVVGELSWFAANMVFQRAGAKILTIPVDDDGIDTDAMKKLCQKHQVRMLYLTPHHHYPTTVTLSAQRRIDLLELSVRYGFIILEDDYDYDFHYGNSQVLPLASADSEGMTVYLGSFGRSLAPGFRAGFVVAPQNLIDEMYKFLGIIDRQGDVFTEQVLGEMIEEGEIHRHLKKTLKIYQERRDYFSQLLQTELGSYVKFKIPSGGLALWTQWNFSINLMKLSRKCLENEVSIPKSLLYQNRNISAIRLGFGSLNQNEMKTAVEKLSEVLRDF